jgi:hypothetical protein
MKGWSVAVSFELFGGHFDVLAEVLGRGVVVGGGKKGGMRPVQKSHVCFPSIVSAKPGTFLK